MNTFEFGDIVDVNFVRLIADRQRAPGIYPGDNHTPPQPYRFAYYNASTDAYVLVGGDGKPMWIPVQYVTKADVE